MNIQYYHNRLVSKYVFELGDINSVQTVLSAKGGSTYAVDVPKKDFFEIAKKNRDSNVVVALGVAVCSLKDNYCKATGREFSKTRLADTAFEFSWVELSDGTEKFFLINDDVSLTFKTHGDRIYFIEAL